MARKRNSVRLLLDTSAVVHQLHGHTLRKAKSRSSLRARARSRPSCRGGATICTPNGIAEESCGQGIETQGMPTSETMKVIAR